MSARSKHASGAVEGAVIVLVAMCGCGGPEPVRPPPLEDAMQAKVDPSLPLIELDRIDLGRTVTRAQDSPAPPALGSSLPPSDFSIRFNAARAPNDKRPPHPLLFRILRRGANGDVATLASCFLKPSLQTDDTIQYEGTCERPVAAGAALIEISWLDESYLVLRVESR